MRDLVYKVGNETVATTFEKAKEYQNRTGIQPVATFVKVEESTKVGGFRAEMLEQNGKVTLKGITQNGYRY